MKMIKGREGFIYKMRLEEQYCPAWLKDNSPPGGPVAPGRGGHEGLGEFTDSVAQPGPQPPLYHTVARLDDCKGPRVPGSLSSKPVLPSHCCGMTGKTPLSSPQKFTKICPDSFPRKGILLPWHR